MTVPASKYIFLIVVTVLGAFFRLAWLDVRPVGFTWDEAALGYNSFSILKTGRDEHGVRTPVVFKSFGDYKPGLYIYLTTPSVYLLGLNEFSTRVPSAIAGVIIIPLLYLLAKILFPHIRFVPESVSLIGAINPWLIHFSRGAWEANLFAMFLLLGIVSYLRKKYLVTVVALGLTFWIYQGAKLLTPLVIILLLSCFRNSVKKINSLLAYIVLFIAIVFPIISGLNTQSGRLKIFSLFSYTRSNTEINRLLANENKKTPDLAFYFFHSEIYSHLNGFLERYLNHFSPRFLFFEGDWSNYRHTTPYSGYFLVPEIITIIVGIFFITKSNGKGKVLLFGLLLIFPIASALSRDIVSGVRSLPLSIPLVVISGVGLAYIFRKLSMGLVLLTSLALFFVYHVDLFVTHAQNFSAQDWLYGYKEAIELVNQSSPGFRKISFTDSLGQPYIFLLFYNKVDPKLVQHQLRFISSESGDVGGVKEWSNYTFGKIFWPAVRGDSSTIFIGNQYELPDQDMNPSNLVRLGEIYYPNGSHALRIVGLK